MATTQASAATTLYAGVASPGSGPMVLLADRSRVSRLLIQYETECFSYSSILARAALRTATLDRKGRFSARVVTSVLDSPRVWWTGDRQPDEIIEEFQGSVGRSSSKGTVRATLRFLDGSTCTTGARRWALTHKPGRVFGGLTSQSMPIVVELTPGGGRISHLHVAWSAPCESDGGFVITDFLTNFTLRRGALDDAFTQTFPFDGGSTSVAYRVTSRVGTATATGTLNVTLTASDEAGTVLDTCATPTVRWKAQS